MRRALASAGVLAATAAILSGCAGTSGTAMHEALSALTVQAPPTPPPTKPPPVKPCNPTASLSPTSLPAPGHMPAGSYMEQIYKHGSLVAGVDQNTLLFSSFNPRDRQIEGLEVSLLREIAKAIFGDPNRLQLVAITSPPQRFTAVENGGNANIVADAITMTCARKKLVDFSSEYYDAKQRLLVPTNSPITGFHDLGGKRVCVTGGTTDYNDLLTVRPKPIIVPVTQRTDCLVKLQESQVDAISDDDAILLGYAAQDPFLKVLAPPLAPDPYGMAMNKNHPEFVRFVNAVLAQLQRSGRLAALYDHWLGKADRGHVPAPPKPQYEG
jgi:polar amino acid transport system substrate-binding protein